MSQLKRCSYKIKLFSWIILFFSFALPTQTLSQNMGRSKLFYFTIGPEYRVTPVYKPNDLSKQAAYTNPDMQNSGLALNLGIDYYFTENFSIGFKNSFRYDLITSQIDSSDPSGQGISDTKKDLLIGYHFDLGYRFQIFKKGDLLLNAGISLLNRNSEFTVRESVFDESGQEIGTVTYLADSKFSANKISVGYGKGKSKLMLGMYITRSSGYFEETTTFMIPFLNFSYNFGKL